MKFKILFLRGYDEDNCFRVKELCIHEIKQYVIISH